MHFNPDSCSQSFFGNMGPLNKKGGFVNVVNKKYREKHIAGNV